MCIWLSWCHMTASRYNPAERSLPMRSAVGVEREEGKLGGLRQRRHRPDPGLHGPSRGRRQQVGVDGRQRGFSPRRGHRLDCRRQRRPGHGASDRHICRSRRLCRCVVSRRGNGCQDVDQHRLRHAAFQQSGKWSRTAGALIAPSLAKVTMCAEPPAATTSLKKALTVGVGLDA